jgi:hypothetical protein
MFGIGASRTQGEIRCLKAHCPKSPASIPLPRHSTLICTLDMMITFGFASKV